MKFVPALLALSLVGWVTACSSPTGKTEAPGGQDAAIKKFVEQGRALKNAVLCGSDDLYEVDTPIRKEMIDAVRQGAEAGELGCELTMAKWGLAWTPKSTPQDAYAQLASKANKSSADQLKLARMAELGYGRSYSIQDAAALFEASAKGNNTGANLALGRFYERGIHVPRNAMVAGQFYLAGSRSANDFGEQALTRLFPENAVLTPSEVSGVQAIWGKLLNRRLRAGPGFANWPADGQATSPLLRVAVTKGKTEPTVSLVKSTGHAALDAEIIQWASRIRLPKLPVFATGTSSFAKDVELNFNPGPANAL